MKSFQLLKIYKRFDKERQKTVAQKSMRKKKLRKVVVCSITDCFIKNFKRIIIFYHDFRLQPSLYKKDFCPC